MRSDSRAWLAVVGLGVITVLLTGVICLALPPQLVAWSGLGMLLWVMIAGLVGAHFLASAGVDRFDPLTYRVWTASGWLVLSMCAPAWGLLLFQPNSNLFTVTFPVTLPLALRALFTGGRKPGSAQTMFRTITLVAAFHLVWFFGSTAVATKLYLVALLLVSLKAARNSVSGRATARAA